MKNDQYLHESILIILTEHLYFRTKFHRNKSRESLVNFHSKSSSTSRFNTFLATIKKNHSGHIRRGVLTTKKQAVLHNSIVCMWKSYLKWLVTDMHLLKSFLFNLFSFQFFKVIKWICYVIAMWLGCFSYIHTRSRRHMLSDQYYTVLY